jgi:heptosyltransferase I
MSTLLFREFGRILLIKPSAAGDVVNALPVLVKLRARYPKARIDWLITPENADLVRHHPDVSNLVLFPRKEYARFGKDWSATVGPLRLMSAVRKTGYDLVIDLHGQLRSAAFALTSGAPVRIGFDRPRRRGTRGGDKGFAGMGGRHGWAGAREGSWLAYTHRILLPTLEVHAVDRYLWVGPMLGLDEGPPDVRIHLPDEERAKVVALLRSVGVDEGRLAVLVPGTIWETKHWDVAGFAQVGRHLRDSGFSVVLAGTGRDRGRCEAIVAACPGAEDLSGRTSLAGLVALIERSDLCVTNDSGSMHVAAAVGRPLVSVFGPTDEGRTGPYRRPHAVVRADLPCAPCFLRNLRDCPSDHLCMKKVTAPMVIERVERVLHGHGP